MALRVADRVKQTTNTTGSGTLALNTTPGGFQSFSSALSDSDTTYYVLVENDDFEIGFGTYTSNTLQRDFILQSSDSDNKINLGGSGAVFIGYPADKSVYKDGENQVVVGASGLVLSNGTIIKDGKITELTDIDSSGTPTSTHLMSFNITNYGLTIGNQTGWSNGNTLIGHHAGSGLITGSDSTMVGYQAGNRNQAGNNNTFIGHQAGPTHPSVGTTIYNSTALGYQAGNKMGVNSTAIGYQSALSTNNTGFVSVGVSTGSGLGADAVAVGRSAGHDLNEQYAIAVGYQAGYEGGGISSTWLGHAAGYSSNGATRSIGLGYQAGKSTTGDDCIYLGNSAGQSNTSDDYLFIANAAPSSNGTLIKGDMTNKRVAVGKADITLDSTLHIGINAATHVGLIVKSASAQSADLTQWQNAAGSSVASMAKSGVLTVNGLHASGAGVQVDNTTPAVTTNTIYNIGGDLYFNGKALAEVTETPTIAQFNYTSGVASYASGEALSLTYASGLIATNTSNITTATATANYASGQALSLAYASGLTPNIATNTSIANYASGQSLSLTYASGLTATNATNITNTTSVANYASGQALSLTYASGLTATNAGNITTVTSTANYASGQALSLTYASGLTATNATNITSVTSTANYASGQVLSLATASGVAAYASGVVRGGIAKFNKVGINTDSPAYGLDIVGAGASGLIQTSGVIVGNSGLVLANNTPGVTTNTLYNDAGTLSWNGSAVGGGGASDTATYASGQALSLTYASGLTATNASNIIAVSGIAHYASGQSLSLSHASGVATSLLTASGTTTALINSSGVATYASGVVRGGIARFNKVGINTDSPAYGLDVVGAGASGLIQTSGIIVGNSGLVLASNTPGVTTNTLYNNGGNLYFNGSQLASAGGASATATYASGQALSLTYASGLTVTNSAIANYASGQALSLSHASGVTTSLINSSGIATYASGVAANILPVTLASGSVYIADGNNHIIDSAFKLNTTANILHTPTTKGGSFVVAKDGVNHTVGVSCVAINNGAYARSYGQQSIGIGNDAIASALRSVTIGNTINNGTASRVMIGAYQTALLDFAKEDGVFRISDLELQNGDNASNAAQFTVMKTWTSSTNHEGLRLGTDGVYHTISSVAGTGGGTVRDISINSDLNVSGVATFQQNMGLRTTAPAYGIQVVGAGASGLIQSSGILIGPSGIGVGTTTPAHPIDVVQHSGVVRASGMHSAISMNADAATVIFDLDQATTHGVTLGNNRTLALSNVQIGDKFLIRLQQDGTGSRTVTWFNHISWAGGSAPTLTTTANKADLLGFLTASGTGSDYWFDGLVVGQNI